MYYLKISSLELAVKWANYLLDYLLVAVLVFFRVKSLKSLLAQFVAPVSPWLQSDRANIVFRARFSFSNLCLVLLHRHFHAFQRLYLMFQHLELALE